MEIVPNLIEPRPNLKEWWDGDPQDLPLLEVNEDNPSLLIFPDFLDAAQCQILIDCYERNYQQKAEFNGGEFWDGRYIQMHDLLENEIDAVRIMAQIRHLSNLHIINEFACGEPVHPDCAQLVRWHEGLEMRPHADNIKANGEPNNTSHRTYSSILYLNDDYTGGETYFPGLGFRVKPKQGALVMFGAGHEYVHGVTKVTAGLRYMYSGWFTEDVNWIDRTANKIY